LRPAFQFGFFANFGDIVPRSKIHLHQVIEITTLHGVTRMKSKVSPILFLVTVLCFLLPFITVSCNGQKIASLTGTELAFGSSVEQPQIFGGATAKRHIDAEPIATIAFLCALAGIAVGFLVARMPLVSGIVGAVGTLFLLILMGKISGDAGKQAQGLLQIDYGPGFILSVLLFIAATAWNGWLFFVSRQPGMAASPPLAQSAAAGGATAAPSGISCPHCGNALPANAKFCGGCGKAL
jgi:zinc ribbon protein